MNDIDRNHFEQRLLRERERTQEALQHADEAARIGTLDDGELTQYSQHTADHGTDTMEGEKALMFMGKESEQLALIDEALRRLYKEPDRFGRCDECGTAIDRERLELVPWTTHCVECQAASEGR